MSLMESMRSGSDSTPMQLIALLIVVSFVGWGVGVSGNKTGDVATVNGEPITDMAFSQAYRTAENQMSRRSDKPMTEDERLALREKVLQDLVRQRALLQEAQRLGLEVSSKEIAEALLELPFLKDDKGEFDKRAYLNFLRQRGLTRANFEDQIREDLLVRKLQELMILGASVSDAAVEAQYVDSNTKLDVQYVRVRPGAFRVEEPAEADVLKFEGEHADEIRARYDDDFAAKYDLPESVDLRIVRLPVRDDGLGVAELKERLVAAKAQITAGGDFAEVARRLSEDASAADGGLLKGRRVSDLDKPLADAVAKLQPGQIGDVVVTDGEVRLVKLETRNPARQVPFEEVQGQIAKELLVESAAPAAAAAFAEKELLPAWKEGGAAPEALVASKGLEVLSTGLVEAAGGGLLKPPAKMMDAARAAKVGDVLPEVYEEDGILWVGALVGREDADMTRFASEKAKIREQALLQRRFEFFQDWVDDVVARADVKR